MAKKLNKVAGVPGIDPTLPDVSLILGGVERHLVYDYAAIVLVEKATGVNLFQGMLSPELNFTTIGSVLWAVLLKENPTLTIDEVGSWITPRNAMTIYHALFACWYASIPEPKDDDDSEGK